MGAKKGTVQNSFPFLRSVLKTLARLSVYLNNLFFPYATSAKAGYCHFNYSGSCTATYKDHSTIPSSPIVPYGCLSHGCLPYLHT